MNTLIRKIGILLVNLGTPLSPNPKDVHRYLIEFLTDPRVMDLPWLKRQLLVRGIIVPSRYKASAASYQQIWTEQGSPLMIHSYKVQSKLQKLLGKQFVVELAMRYQEPSLQKGISNLINSDIDHLIVVPMFPQYASATTGSVHERVQEILKNYTVIPKLTLINHYPVHHGLIESFAAVAQKYPLNEYDHILFSFHGLPEGHLRKADDKGGCLKSNECCHRLSLKNRNCYSAHCFATAKAIANRLKIPQERYSLSFQSRLGKDPWLEPFTSNVITQLAKAGKKKVLVFCPSFVCDCLETLYEIGIEYAAEFKHAGGERLDLVEGLNDHPLWIEALRTIIFENV